MLLVLFRTLEALIEYNMNALMVKDECGRTVLHLACQKGHLNIVQVIESHLDTEKLQEMYKLCDNEGNTVLHFACQSQKENIVRYLVDKRRTHIDARNSSKNGEAPIHVAAQFQSTDVIDVLLNQGAAIETKDAKECTPLHHAARCNQRDMISHLFKR